jgi:D-alanyl-D-alanine carboxypeptidase
LSEPLGRAADAVVNAGVPGVAVYVRDKGRTTVVARGYDDVAAKRPMRVADRFRVGSVTKSFVATIVLQLVAEGKLSLRDTVEKWLPGVVPNGSAITVRELLSHRSGLFDYVHDKRLLAPYVKGAAPPRLDAAPDRPDGDRTQTPVRARRRSKAELHEHRLRRPRPREKVTGYSLADELNTRIFRPLGLEQTSFARSPGISGRHAHGYTKVFGPTPVDITGISPSLFGAAGGIISTPADVARFYRALLQGRLIPKRLLNQMKAREGHDPKHPDLLYGLGLYRQPVRCSLVWGHNGDTPGYNVTAFNSGDGARQVVFMINTDSDSLTPAQGKALNTLLDVAYCG